MGALQPEARYHVPRCGLLSPPGQPIRLLLTFTLEPCLSVTVGTLSDGPWDVALHDSFLAVSSLNLVKSVTPSLLVSCRVSCVVRAVRVVRVSCVIPLTTTTATSVYDLREGDWSSPVWTLPAPDAAAQRESEVAYLAVHLQVRVACAHALSRSAPATDCVAAHHRPRVASWWWCSGRRGATRW